MASRPRRFAEGAPAHVTARGVLGLTLFPTTEDCFTFLAILERVTRRIGWDVLAWCLMTTHYHLLVVTPDPVAAPGGLRALNSLYAREFNARHVRRGHVFGEKYAETLIESEQHLQAAHDYVLENPVRAGLVRSHDHWAWSGGPQLRPRPLRRIVAPSMQNRDNLVRLAG